mmetsp:Transcript_26127/g.62962  ORF Transcript_26127/g.62962 Transcript_26127/m.62962 type:complete len:321 (+) Transcript_26127:89-1051(+)|eukprot:CAMPEP_0114524472 /NCGR_PEP_ID=MMETSP0109-20121206/21877_1 /TAXON_ID=29199 /ORGANISM="Chlorarachnion reptans, Strain CCCM449" /LENGTH=320 /DNA_ID=CAMNT_0001705925 /DNA_START=81 /DNA_END=1043 /DNA_ORIENTATION=+
MTRQLKHVERDDVEQIEKMITHNRVLPAACHQILLVLIFLASIVLMLLEVLYLQHIRRKGLRRRGLHVSIYVVEVFLDVLILADVTRRARKSASCAKYLENVWNWLDLLTLWIVVVHWIVVIVDPLVQVYSDAWIVLRYSINSARIIYWMIRNYRHLRHRHYKALVTSAGDLEWLPVGDLSEEPATNMLFDDDDLWGDKDPEFVVEQFVAPNAVNAAEAKDFEEKQKEEERLAAEAKEAEEKQINDILGPEFEEEENDKPTGNQDKQEAIFDAGNVLDYDAEDEYALEDAMELHDDIVPVLEQQSLPVKEPSTQLLFEYE